MSEVKKEELVLEQVTDMEVEYLSPHFTYDEMIRSNWAIRNGVKNVPPQLYKDNLKLLCNELLEKIRALAGNKILRVSSGYRNSVVNKGVGSTNPKSQHTLGQAADFTIDGMTVEQVYQMIKNSDLEYDQMIQEFNGWVHISWRPVNRRKSCLRFKHVKGKLVSIKEQ